MSPKKVPSKHIREIELCAIATYTLFRECLQKAGLLNDQQEPVKEWALKLNDRLRQVPEIYPIFEAEGLRIDYHNYLRDRYNKVAGFVRQGSAHLCNMYDHTKILPLLRYVNREDYKEFDASFRPAVVASVTATAPASPQNEEEPVTPVSIPVMYTPVVFGRFSILRNPDCGLLHIYANGDIIFEGDSSLLIRKHMLSSVTRFSMYADPEMWVKIDYQKGHKTFTAYFAEIAEEGEMIKLLVPSRLLMLLDK